MNTFLHSVVLSVAALLGFFAAKGVMTAGYGLVTAIIVAVATGCVVGWAEASISTRLRERKSRGL
jgi:hypothetical protein